MRTLLLATTLLLTAAAPLSRSTWVPGWAAPPIGFEPANQLVVIDVCVVAERVLALQDDHRHTVGLRLVVELAHSLHGFEGRGVVRSECYRVFTLDLFE